MAEVPALVSCDGFQGGQSDHLFEDGSGGEDAVAAVDVGIVWNILDEAGRGAVDGHELVEVVAASGDIDANAFGIHHPGDIFEGIVAQVVGQLDDE